MGCGGFTCSRNALAALNVLYILVAFILIGVAAYSKAVAIVTSIGIVGGIIACGVFLLIIAIIGLVGAVKHHQVLLFFYMIILFLLFLLQFSIACACLAMNDSQREKVAENGWNLAPVDLKLQAQHNFDCCGIGIDNQNNVNQSDGMSHPYCAPVEPQITNCCGSLDNVSDAICCSAEGSVNGTCPCDTCWDKMKDPMEKATKGAGGVGLFFSFTEILGVWLTVRFRNQKDPRANPSAFL